MIMFGKKTKALRAELDKIKAENEELKNRIQGLEQEVAHYKEQETSVARAITEAGIAAARIEEEANTKRDALIEKATQVVKTAHDNADAVMAQADEDAKKIREEAESYSDNTRTDVNIYVERTIMASQLEVKKRKDVSNELNELLKKTASYLVEQNKAYIELINKVVDESDEEVKSLCHEVEKCNCSCKDCEDPCSVKADDTETEKEAAEPETFAEEVDASKLPEEYDSPSQLMQNIYYLLKRQLPEDYQPSEEVRQDNPDKKEEPEAEPEIRIDSELPHDEDLAKLVSDVV